MLTFDKVFSLVPDYIPPVGVLVGGGNAQYVLELLG